MGDRMLPAEFSDLEPFVQDWCLDNEPARYAKRLASTMDEIQKFYDAIMPRAEAAIQYLEQFPLDTMQMVGTLQLQGLNYGLVQGKDGLVHRVLPGMYMGQNDGKVVGVSSTKISIIEIVPDGLGGYIERPASLALNE